MVKQMIETKQLTKKYQEFTALDKVDIQVAQGEIYGLIGDNGSGKSTLMKVLAGQIFATNGEVSLLGYHRSKDLEHVRKKFGFMIEETGLFPDMTVEQLLHYYYLQKGMAIPNQIEELVMLTGLSEKKKTKCGKLSLGQKQRLGLAVALMGEPQVLVLDEPINGLDPSGIAELRIVLSRLNREKNITILLSSHILSELQQIATTYGFLSHGKLLEEISAKKLQDKCADCVEIQVTDVKKYAVLLEQFYPAATYHVLPDQFIRIYHPEESVELYSRLASENNIFVTKLQMIETSLEDYYLELKKRGAEHA